MGFLRLFAKPATPQLERLPTGSFTVDSTGRVLGSTLPQSFPAEYTARITELVLSNFRQARQSQIPLNELVVDYAGLRLTAREMRGGAIVFLAPRFLRSR